MKLVKIFSWRKFPAVWCILDYVYITCTQVCLDRAMKRGQSSGRKDDNREAFVKRYYGTCIFQPT